MTAQSNFGTQIHKTATKLLRLIRLRAVTGQRSPVNCVVFSPTEKTVASSSANDVIRLWDVQTGRQVRMLRHGNNVNALVFSPDGRMLASRGDDGIVRLWDTSTGRQQRALNGHQREWYALAISPDG